MTDNYDRHYARGGWRYNLAEQSRHMVDVLVPLTGWPAFSRVVEVGAGMGHHAEMLRRLGFVVTAVEMSAAGVEAARNLYPELDVVQADLRTWSPPEPSNVFARGASPWHYELNGLNEKGLDVPAITARCFEWIPSGGTFVLQIVTDLSETKRKSGVWNNPVEAYERLFSRFGDVSVTDWAGNKIASNRHPESGVIVVTRKP